MTVTGLTFNENFGGEKLCPLPLGLQNKDYVNILTIIFCQGLLVSTGKKGVLVVIPDSLLPLVRHTRKGSKKIRR